MNSNNKGSRIGENKVIEEKLRHQDAEESKQSSLISEAYPHDHRSNI
jgi:hypothetical protein